jgi:glycosyltransferase involved in cell wall biosynthesis
MGLRTHRDAVTELRNVSLPEPSNAHPRVSVIVPAYNESALIADVLDSLDAYLAGIRERYDCELIVVDDGSTDGTRSILESWSAKRPGRVRIVTHEQNAGLVAAIRTGCAAAAGTAIVIVDADLSYAPETIGALLDAQTASGALVAIASPYMRGGRTGNVPFERLAASRLANLLLSACVGGRIKTFTGMVRSYDAATLHSILLEPERGEFNSWIVSKLIGRGARYVEVPAALIWPANRTQEPSRLTWSKFMARVGLTLVTAANLVEMSTSVRKRALIK